METDKPMQGMTAAELETWEDLNGMPAVVRALETLVEGLQSAEDRLADVEARVAELEWLWSEEIMRELGSSKDMRDELAMDQLALLNAWLAEHEPDAYFGNPEQDTATVIIGLLEQRHELRRLVEEVRRKLAGGRTVGHDWQAAALDAENFILDSIGGAGTNGMI